MGCANVYIGVAQPLQSTYKDVRLLLNQRGGGLGTWGGGGSMVWAIIACTAVPLGGSQRLVARCRNVSPPPPEHTPSRSYPEGGSVGCREGGGAGMMRSRLKWYTLPCQRHIYIEDQLCEVFIGSIMAVATQHRKYSHHHIVAVYYSAEQILTLPHQPHIIQAAQLLLYSTKDHYQGLISRLSNRRNRTSCRDASVTLISLSSKTPAYPS